MVHAKQTRLKHWAIIAAGKFDALVQKQTDAYHPGTAVADEAGGGPVISPHRDRIVGQAAGRVTGTLTDVTEGHELALLRYALDQAVILAVTDVQGRITYANEKFCAISGYSRQELLGQDHRILSSGRHSKEFFRDMYRTIARDAVWRGELCNRAKDGSHYWVDTTIISRPDERGKPIAYLAIWVDVTARKAAEAAQNAQNAQIAYMAHHDALTGLANRILFQEKIEQALIGLQQDRERFVVFMLDLDRFKDVNDSLGHPVGDELLKAVARRLQSCTRATDTVARFGGDEFAILQTIDSDQKESATILANRLLENISAPYDLDGHKVIVGTSIGIALAPGHGTRADELLRNADLALHKVKSKGRNGYRFFEAEMETEASSRRILEAELRQAISCNEFELYYQPVIHSATRKLAGAEALIRWRHPQRGIVRPDDFIPLAEETGLIAELGEWVLRQACTEAATWASHLSVAVNLSPAQFRKSNLVDVVATAISDSGLAPERIELEITESVLLQKSAENIGILHQLRSLGPRIVLDDFGTGFSSLSYVQAFPFDKIKIDKSFISEISSRPSCAAIVCAVTGLARSLDIITTAEGVETEEQFEFLIAAGCNQAQGYLFGQPRPASELNLSDVEGRAGKVNAA